MNVLVTAASAHGSTAEIANAIAEEISSQDIDVTVAAPDAVGALDDFDAVVLGSAVYAGHWQKPALRLAARLASEGGGRPVWLFSSGPVGDPSRTLVRQMGADPVDVPALVRSTGARQHRMFAGRLERSQLRGFQRAALWVVRGLEGDFRDWAVVRAWARSIARQLAEPHARNGAVTHAA